MQARLYSDDYKLVLRSSGRGSIFIIFLNSWALTRDGGQDLESWLAGAQINQDLNWWPQHLAGMGLNFDNP